MTPSAVGTFSCVIDEDPRFHLETLRWYASITAVAGVHPSDVVVHVVGPTGSDALSILRDKGVTVRSVPRFDARSAPATRSRVLSAWLLPESMGLPFLPMQMS
jgi:hypothetical protein